MKTSFKKRIYTYALFKNDVRQIFDHMNALKRASRSGRVSKAFAEKIMLVVSAVNGCRYCCYGHSKAALAAGVPVDELQKLLALEIGSFSASEVIALTFAQHFAESASQPDPDAWQRFVMFFGEETAQDILAYLKIITFGNLLGNTLDALLGRLSGNPAPGSNLREELSVLLGVVWMPISRLAMQKIHK